MINPQEAAADRLAEWTAPKLVELRLGVGQIEAAYDVGTDGEDPGFPFTSDS